MISASEIIEEVRKIAKEYPDCKMQEEVVECSYHFENYGNGMVGCIMGNALKNLGAEGDFDNVPHPDLGRNYTPDIAALLDHLKIPATIDQKAWLNSVQGYQDGGYSWIESVKKTDNREMRF